MKLKLDKTIIGIGALIIATLGVGYYFIYGKGAKPKVDENLQKAEAIWNEIKTSKMSAETLTSKKAEMEVLGYKIGARGVKLVKI